VRPLGYYRGFGLTVASELPLGGFDAEEGLPGSPDVFVRLQSGPFPVLTEAADHFSFKANEDACFLIRGGRDIDVWLAPDADLTLATDLLQGTAFAALLFQRGEWPVHVSAVHVDGGVWLFSGKSGEGKSTLAAWMNATLGWTILSDDAGVLCIDEGRVWFAPGARNLKLLPDAVDALPAYRAVSGVAASGDSEGKVHFRLSRFPVAGRLPVRGFVDLASTDGGSATVAALRGARALQAVRAALYRPWFGRNLCAPASALKFCADVSRLMPMYCFARPRDYPRIPESNGILAAVIDRPAIATKAHAGSEPQGACLPA
jgi:hypothetical protein